MMDTNATRATKRDGDGERGCACVDIINVDVGQSKCDRHTS